MEENKVTLSTGVVFNITNVPPYAFDAMKKKIAPTRPNVPTVYIETKDRSEQNPNDPDYIEAMEAYDIRLTESLIDMILTLGTEVDKLPEGFPKHTDKGWSDKLELAGLDIPEEDHPRYLAWIKLCAARTLDDLQALILACARSAGVTEEDAAEAAGSFRGT